MVRVIRASHNVCCQVDENSFSSAPSCYRIDLSIGILTDFRCGSSPLTQILERSAAAPALSSATAPATSIASSSAPVMAADRPAAASSKTWMIAGSILGGVAAVAIVLVVALRRLSDLQLPAFITRMRLLHASDRGLEQPAESDKNIKRYPTRPDPISKSQLRTWRAFLSMYGEEGIVLRDLMMLVSALYSPVTIFREHQHWSQSGEHDVAISPSSNDSFLAVLREASNENDLLVFEKKLEADGIITVRRGNRFRMDQDWITNGRSWCALSSVTDSSVNYTEVSRDLLAIYSQMPHRDVHPIAERYRELFYNHAHVAILGILPVAQEAKLDIATEALFCHVALEVLSHRYQVNDSELMKYLQGRMKRIYPGRRPRRGGESQEMQRDIGASVNFHLAELRRLVEQYERTKGRWYAVRPSLHDTEMFLSDVVHTENSRFGRRGIPSMLREKLSIIGLGG